jgi:hypothetical protein
LTPQGAGILILAVPVGRDLVVWNAHRVYGRRRLTKLLQRWTVDSVIGLSPDMLDTTGIGLFQEWTHACLSVSLQPFLPWQASSRCLSLGVSALRCMTFATACRFPRIAPSSSHHSPAACLRPEQPSPYAADQFLRPAGSCLGPFYEIEIRCLLFDFSQSMFASNWIEKQRAGADYAHTTCIHIRPTGRRRRRLGRIPNRRHLEACADGRARTRTSD